MRREFFCAIALAMAMGTVYAGGSISFDNPRFKLGEDATGEWKVEDGYQIINSTSTENLSKLNLPHRNGPATGTFTVRTLMRSAAVNDAIVFMMLKDKKTGISENEKNALRASCTVVAIEGHMSGSTYPRGAYDRAVITIMATGYPAALGTMTGGVTFNEDTVPDNDSFTSATNTINWTSVEFQIGGTHNFIGVKASGTINFGGLSFVADGVFSGVGLRGVPFR